MDYSVIQEYQADVEEEVAMSRYKFNFVNLTDIVTQIHELK